MKNLHKPKELLAWLRLEGLAPLKGLSQNFLIDHNILNKIVKAGELERGQTVLEIGPGPGILTQALLEEGASVIAIEKDRSFARLLHRLQTSDERLHVIEADILEVPLETFCSCAPIKIISNIPYHLTTPILARFISHPELFSSLIFMVQEEVAKRLVATPSTKAYSSLTLFTQFYSKVSLLFSVSPSCFYPKPSVRSAIVKIEPKSLLPLTSPEAFFRLIHTAFQQRRKQLKKSLSNLYISAKIQEALESLNLNPQCRPEELSLENFLGLYFQLVK